MTKWLPELSGRSGPRYLAIADAIADAVRDGSLPPGTRLPTHRDLAWRLHVTVGTVTRAYAEAARRGLVGGEVGRGTYVLPQTARIGPTIDPLGSPAATSANPVYLSATGVINLSLNQATVGPQAEALARTMAALAAGGGRGLTDIVAYAPPAGMPLHRAAGRQWLSRAGLDLPIDRVLVSAGCQHAQTVALITLTRPGDTLLCEALAYPGLTALARHLGLTLEPVAIDAEGVRPDALEAACRHAGRRTLYLTPTVQNPTGAIMGESRRRELVRLAQRLEISLIEDDVFGFLAPGMTPLASLAPERTAFITSVSKALMPGLRIGFLGLPEAWVGRAAEAIRTTSLGASPIMAEVVARWLADGTADELTRFQVAEARARREMAARRLAHRGVKPGGAAFHVWLPLHDTQAAEAVAAEARALGAPVASGSAFRVGRGPEPAAIRVSLSAPADRATLARGLDLVDMALERAPADHDSVLI
jgi:DNA-binding transcriptional MocR family regulator